MELIHNPRCSKSRQALALLEEKKINPEIRLYLNDSLSKDELKNILKKLNVEASSIIRKGEKDYKDNFKGKDLSEEEWIDAMLKFPKLIERPILVNGNKAVVGRPPEDILQII
jgi:arsenate reductase